MLCSKRHRVDVIHAYAKGVDGLDALSSDWFRRGSAGCRAHVLIAHQARNVDVGRVPGRPDHDPVVLDADNVSRAHEGAVVIAVGVPILAGSGIVDGVSAVNIGDLDRLRTAAEK